MDLSQLLSGLAGLSGRNNQEVVEETVEVDQIDGQPLVERTMLIEDHPDFNYMEGAEDRVYEKIKRYNANPAAVTGIMANMLGENDTFDYKKKQDKNKRGDGLGPGRGLFQFDSMKKNYGIYLDKAGIPDSENAQLYWAMDQIYTDNPNDSELGGPQARKLRRILDNPKTTPEEATTAFFEIFENPSAIFGLSRVVFFFPDAKAFIPAVTPAVAIPTPISLAALLFPALLRYSLILEGFLFNFFSSFLLATLTLDLGLTYGFDLGASGVDA